MHAFSYAHYLCDWIDTLVNFTIAVAQYLAANL